MIRVSVSVALLWIGSSWAFANPAGVRFGLMHTLPECDHPGQPSTWCTRADAARVAEASGMEKQVGKLLNQATAPETARITIAYFSFSNRAVFDQLCEKGREGFRIEGFFDNDYRGADQFPSLLANDCQGPEGDNVRVHFLGQKKIENGRVRVWRLHHNKFLIVDPGTEDKPVSVNFSSGNLSSFGLSLHFDHWVMMQAPPESQMVQQHYCVIESMRQAIVNDIDDPKLYRSRLDRCLKRHTDWTDGTDWIEAAIQSEGVAPLFSPNPKNTILKALVDQIDRVQDNGRISGAMQHFRHRDIARALQRAATRGVQIRFIMDDDVMTGESGVPGADSFYEDELDPAVSGFDAIRFMVTNAKDRQMMHNKFLILEGIDGKRTRVFSGAGHFTSSAMMNNYENFYLTENATLTRKYKELFASMWKNSVSFD